MIERYNPVDNPARKSVVTAATVDMQESIEGICQECGKQMALTACGDIPVYSCMEHRIVLPLRNKE